VIKYESNDIDGALAAFEKAKELNGTKPHPMLHKYLAGVYLKKNDHAKAASELEIYLAQSPDAKDAEQIRKTIAQLKRSN
jgi:regulator of sirC expression with transglutaminase-like and TPR domain